MTLVLVAAAVMSFATAADGLSYAATKALGTMSREIAEKHFVNSRCLAVITEDDNAVLDHMQSLDIPAFHVHLPRVVLEESNRLTAETEFEEYAWDDHFLAPMDAACLAFVVQTSNMKLMAETFARLAHSPRSEHRANRMYLYIPSVDIPDANFEAGIKELFQMRQMDFMPDLLIAKLVNENNQTLDQGHNVLSPSDDSSTEENLKIELLTHRYVGPDPSERLTLDTWVPNRGFLHEADLFPDKITNMMGKEVTLSAIFYPPYSAVYPDEEPPIYDGLEFRIMSEWARENNLTWRVLYKPNDWWGEIYNNGSGWGLSGHVSMDKADVAFGAIYLWENEHHYTDYSSVYFRASLTIVHPKPKLLPGWTVIISPFSAGMWVAVGISVLVATLALHVTSQSSMQLLGTGRGKVVVNMYSTWLECAFRTVGLLVLQVPPDERDFSTPRHVPMRHLVTWLILFFLVVTTAYSGGLASVLTLPRYEKPIDTPNDMAEHNSKWGAMDECFVFFLRESLEPTMLSLVKNFVLGTEEYFTKRTKSGDMGFAIEKLQNGHFALPPYVNEETMQYLRIMKEDYVNAHCVFMVRKGSPYMRPINAVIRKLRDRGVVLYWENMAVRKYMSTRDQLAVANSRYDVDNGPTQLLIRHAMGAFYLLGYGLIVSLVVFISELIKHNCFQSKDGMDAGMRSQQESLQKQHIKYLSNIK